MKWEVEYRGKMAIACDRHKELWKDQIDVKHRAKSSYMCYFCKNGLEVSDV